MSFLSTSTARAGVAGMHCDLIHLQMMLQFFEFLNEICKSFLYAVLFPTHADCRDRLYSVSLTNTCVASQAFEMVIL